VVVLGLPVADRECRNERLGDPGLVVGLDGSFLPVLGSRRSTHPWERQQAVAAVIQAHLCSQRLRRLMASSRACAYMLYILLQFFNFFSFCLACANSVSRQAIRGARVCTLLSRIDQGTKPSRVSCVMVIFRREIRPLEATCMNLRYRPATCCSQ
jgi:hypothetical protein